MGECVFGSFQRVHKVAGRRLSTTRLEPPVYVRGIKGWDLRTARALDIRIRVHRWSACVYFQHREPGSLSPLVSQSTLLCCFGVSDVAHIPTHTCPALLVLFRLDLHLYITSHNKCTRWWNFSPLCKMNIHLKRLCRRIELLICLQRKF